MKSLWSEDGRYLAADQDDGNFVVYDRGAAVFDRWSHEANTPREPVASVPYPDDGVSPAVSPRLIKVTDAQDGIIPPRMYAYWANAWIQPNGEAIVFCGHEDGHARFFSVNLTTDVVTRMGTLPAVEPYLGTTEGWYWDALGWLYLIEGPRLRHVNVFTGSDDVVFDISEMHPSCDLWQSHSSTDGLTHSATVRKIVPDGPYPLLGTLVFSVVTGQQAFYETDTYALDESAISTDGRWLLIKSSPDDDNLVIDLLTDAKWWILKSEGAVGHSDMGDRFVVGADRQNGVCANIDLATLKMHPLFSSWNVGHVALRGPICLVSDETLISRVDLDGSGVQWIFPHGMVGSDYDQQVKANIDPAGKVACFMSNCGTDRQDVYLLVLAG